jgi:hypothetical protein
LAALRRKKALAKWQSGASVSIADKLRPVPGARRLATRFRNLPRLMSMLDTSAAADFFGDAK